VDDWELRRGGTSYSIDTVRHFSERHPNTQLFWLIGADHLPSLPLWRDAHELAERVEFVVIPRPGNPPQPPGPPFRIRELRGWPLAVSSSEIRQRLRAGLRVDHLVPSHVGAALAETKAYRTD
jgi:nicotinate-nucleotide adenylyltransferase